MLDYQAPKDLFKQQVILVTGAGQGLGLQASLAFASHGATVILLGRTQSKLEAAYDAIVEQGLSEPLIFTMDLLKATEADMQSLAEGIYQQLGRLDGILHNATQFDNLSPLAIQTGKQFQDMMQVNVIAPFMLTKACLPLLQQAEQASVLFTSNHAARELKPFWGAHAISKLAADALMQLWAKELDNSHVRFNSVIPGAVQSPQRKKTHPGEVHADLPGAECLMPMYLYLMGRDSAGVTGEVHEAQAPHTQWE
jgi:NAD(P)-dependent dehydrogenase (short-subunit alcohol dehydrogenase family)